jgi:mRNA interferase RelE/StbE
MEVEFLDKFNKDLDKISLKSVKNNLVKLIVSVESAKSINEIHQTKKLKGHKSAYRVRITDYRVGVFVEGNKVTFARFVHRKDIYDVFP